MTTRTTIRAYHGGELEGASWYTTNRGHAAIFGDVAEVEISSSIEPLRFHATDVVGDEEGGYEADARLWAHLTDREAAWAIVEGWEGPGLCIIVREPHYVTVTEAE